jgi:hypothetical protein
VGFLFSNVFFRNFTQQESSEVVLKAEGAWFLLEAKERGLQNSPVATPGRMGGTLEGRLSEGNSLSILIGIEGI